MSPSSLDYVIDMYEHTYIYRNIHIYMQMYVYESIWIYISIYIWRVAVTCVIGLMGQTFQRMTHSVTWLLQMRDMTRSHVWYNLCVHVAEQVVKDTRTLPELKIHLCGKNAHGTWLIHTCEVVWLIHKCVRWLLCAGCRASRGGHTNTSKIESTWTACPSD